VREHAGEKGVEASPTGVEGCVGILVAGDDEAASATAARTMLVSTSTSSAEGTVDVYRWR
jgi:hypothetical protein